MNKFLILLTTLSILVIGYLLFDSFFKKEPVAYNADMFTIEHQTTEGNISVELPSGNIIIEPSLDNTEIDTEIEEQEEIPIEEKQVEVEVKEKQIAVEEKQVEVEENIVPTSGTEIVAIHYDFFTRVPEKNKSLFIIHNLLNDKNIKELLPNNKLPVYLPDADIRPVQDGIGFVEPGKASAKAIVARKSARTQQGDLISIPATMDNAGQNKKYLLDDNAGFVYGFWLKPSADSENERYNKYIVCCDYSTLEADGRTPISYRGHTLKLDKNNYLEFMISMTGSLSNVIIVKSTRPITTDRYTHIGVVFSPYVRNGKDEEGFVSLYLDGTENAVVRLDRTKERNYSPSYAIEKPLGNLTLFGHKMYPDLVFTGNMDNFYFISGYPSSTLISTFYQTRKVDDNGQLLNRPIPIQPLSQQEINYWNARRDYIKEINKLFDKKNKEEEKYNKKMHPGRRNAVEYVIRYEGIAPLDLIKNLTNKL